MKINRRSFVGGAGVATAIAVTGMPYIARGAAKVTLTVANGSPLKHVLSEHGTTPWVERVKELTHGEVEIKYFPSGQVAKVKELMRAVQSGVADIVPVPIGYVTDKMPLNDVSALPGLGTTAKAIGDAHFAALKSGLLAKEFETNHIHPLYVMAFPPYQIVSMTTAIKTVDQFKGRVIRSAGGSMDLVISALGGTPAEIAVSEIYIALQRGTVDSTISAYATIKGYNIQDIAKSMSGNASFGTFVNVLSCNADKWKTLPKDVQDALTKAGLEINVSAAKFMDDQVDQLKAEFKAKGMEIYDFAPEQIAAIDKRLGGVQDEWVKRVSARGLPAAEALKQYRPLIAQG